MLGRVCFILSKEAEGGTGKIPEALLVDLKRHGVESTCVEPLEEAVAEYLAWKCLAKESAADNKTLYVTDREGCFYLLKSAGRYVLPYVHEGNRTASFAGAKYVIEQIEETDFETLDMAYRRTAGLPWDILETERCMVRETTVEDVDCFYQIYEEPSITEYTENLYADREEEIAYTQDYIERVYGFYGYGMWTVIEKRSGQIIGRAGISWREGFAVPELGFVIGVPWQRRGYAYEVCSAILAYAGEQLGFSTVQALVRKGNEKSGNLCRRLGFQEAGEIVLEGDSYVRYLIGDK